MNGNRLILACGLLLCLVGISCEKTQMPVRPELKLSFETIKTQNSIPAEYGNSRKLSLIRQTSQGCFLKGKTRALLSSPSMWPTDSFKIASSLFRAGSGPMGPLTDSFHRVRNDG